MAFSWPRSSRSKRQIASGIHGWTHSLTGSAAPLSRPCFEAFQYHPRIARLNLVLRVSPGWRSRQALTSPSASLSVCNML